MAQKVEGRLRVGQTCELRKEGRTFSTCSFMVEAPQKAGGPMGAPRTENCPRSLA